MNKNDNLKNFNKRFELKKKIEKTDLKNYYIALDRNRNMKVFIKEYENNNNITYYLNKEAKIYKKLKNSTLILKLYWKGIINKKIIFIYEKAGYNLKYIFNKLNNNFSVSTCGLIGIKILEVLGLLQKNEIIVGNMKPKSILISENPLNLNLYISNFKNSIIKDSNFELYENDMKNKIHNKYSSINTYLGIKPSYKDDIETLFYILVYFLNNGKIFKINDEIKIFGKSNINKYFLNEKFNIIAENFCENLPSQMYKYYTYMKTLSILDIPDYKYLIELMESMKSPKVNLYDWIIKGKKLLSLSTSKDSKNSLNSDLNKNNNLHIIQNTNMLENLTEMSKLLKDENIIGIEELNRIFK